MFDEITMKPLFFHVNHRPKTGQHTSELDDAQSTTEGPAAAVSPLVEWSELLGALDLKEEFIT
jgi:hypothetical protein